LDRLARRQPERWRT